MKSTIVIEVIIVVIWMFFIYYEDIFKLKTKSKVSQNQERKKRKESKSKENLIYKNKGIKSFELIDFNEQNLKKTNSGVYYGYVKCEHNSDDELSVAFYNKKGLLFGYAPKGRIRLIKSLKQWHNDSLIAWVNLDWEDKTNKWKGEVYIPIGQSNEIIKKIEETFLIIEENKFFATKKEWFTSEYLYVLDNHNIIYNNLKLIKDKNNLFYDFPKKIIPSLSKKLEENKDWESLIQIEEYKDLIYQLSDVYRNATLKRINKARKCIGK